MNQRQLVVLKIKCLRAMVDVTQMDKITNKEVQEQVETRENLTIRKDR